MKAIAELGTLGVTVTMAAGKLKLEGLSRLDKSKAAAIIKVAKANRDAIIAELAAAPGAAPAPQAVAGRKPCDIHAGLPCHGSEGTCFSRPFWDLKSFDERNVRRKATGLAACPSAERVEKYMVDLSQRG